MNALQAASGFQQVGAFAFGAVVGWYLYFINRHRKEEVKLADVVTVIGAVGGAAVLALFPAGTDLFAAYGIGLASGFFLYFLVLCVLVSRSDNFDVDWFLDGRRKLPTKEQTAEGAGHPMGADRSAPPS